MKAVILVLLGVLCLGSAQWGIWGPPTYPVDSREHGSGSGPMKNTCDCGRRNRTRTRIIGGTETQPNEYLFMLALATRSDLSQFCGASIITKHHGLTAGHCITAYPTGTKFAVLAGAHNIGYGPETPHRRVINVKSAIMHEYYPQIPNYDIALLVFEQPIQFNDYIGPVCLPHQPLNLDGQRLKVIGWGKTTPYGQGSPVLKQVYVNAISLDVCQQYADVKVKDRHQLCTFTSNKGFGQGDSGGPVLWLNPKTNSYVLVGLPSFVYLYQDTNRNADVSTDVSSFLAWIHSKIKATAPGAQACFQA